MFVWEPCEGVARMTYNPQVDKNLTKVASFAASAAVHSSTRIMLAALKFFLGQDEVDPADR